MVFEALTYIAIAPHAVSRRLAPIWLKLDGIRAPSPQMGRADQPIWLARASDMVALRSAAHATCATLCPSGSRSSITSLIVATYQRRSQVENGGGQNQRGFWSRLRTQGRTTGVGLATGIAIGAGLGVALGNLAIGIAIGASIGAAFEVANQRRGRP